MQGVLVLAGATASGKTTLAIALAREFGAEIVGADSRQIYRGMPIGTAAPTEDERRSIPHHLIGFLDPQERYSAARFAADALDAIAAIHERGNRAIVVGGTGFYIRALTGAVSLGSHVDDALRRRLAREAKMHSPAFLHEWLSLYDPARAAALAPADTYRVLRALELAFVQRTTEPQPTSAPAGAGIRFAKIFLDVPLEENDRRIAARTDAMLQNGLIEEAERIGQDAVASSAVGYGEALAYVRGWSTREELRASLARATRRYARRQRSWFRREPQMRWVAPAAVLETAREMLGWT